MTEAPIRRLAVVRHAKSAWPTDVPDLDRPLNGRGRRDAPVLGRWIAERLGTPQTVLCSPALRARQTWQHARPQLPEAPPPTIVDALYAADPTTLLGVVRGLPPDSATALLLAHNPGVQDLVALLTDQTAPMPTSAVAVLTWTGGWEQAAAGSALLDAHAVPRG